MRGRWVKQPVGYYQRPEVLALDDAAEVVLNRGRAYAGETGGFIPTDAMPLLMRNWSAARARKIAAALVAADEWEKAPGGWRIVGWEADQEDIRRLQARRTTDAERQARYRRTKRLTVTGTASGDVLLLRDALEDAGMTPSWASLSQDELDQIDTLVQQHGRDRLVQSARDGWRPNAPARHARAFLPGWVDLRPPRPKKTRPAWCGHCNEETRMTDDDRPRRCPDCGGAA